MVGLPNSPGVGDQVTFAGHQLIWNGSGWQSLVGDFAANQWTSLTEKTFASPNDLMLIEDSDASGAKRKLKHGNIAPYIFKNLATDMAGANSNTAQPWFPDTAADAVTLASNTTYRFGGLLYLTRTAGTTSHTTAIGFAGTAIIASISALLLCKTGDTAVSAAINANIITDLTSVVVKPTASVSATEQIMVLIEGTLRVGTGGGGTFIPQFTYSAAPGGVPTIKANSFFELSPIGTDLVASAGVWS